MLKRFGALILAFTLMAPASAFAVGSGAFDRALLAHFPPQDELPCLAAPYSESQCQLNNTATGANEPARTRGSLRLVE